MEMRKMDRPVTDRGELGQIVDACQVIRIATSDDEGLYIVPMNFGYDWQDTRLTLYVHSPREGRKTAAFRKNPSIAFEMDDGHDFAGKQPACRYGFRYRSIVGNGHIVELADPDEKAHGLRALMRRFSDRSFAFSEKMLAVVSVFRIDVTGFTGKTHY